MEEWERSPLLPQDAAGREPPLSVDSPPTSSRAGLASWEDRARVLRGYSACAPGAQQPPCRRGPPRPLPGPGGCLKCLAFFSNFLFALLALLALAVGLWGLAVKGSLGSDPGRPLPADPMLGLVTGALALSAVSLAGCLGALCESARLLRCFSWGVLALLLLEALAGALVVALWGPLQSGLQHSLRVAVAHYQDDPDLRFLLDQVQQGLRCCGAASYRDWQGNPYFNCSARGPRACSVPASCCVDRWEDGASVNDQCGSGALRLEEAAAQSVVHLRGCGPPLRQWLRGGARALGGFLIAVVVVQGVELLLATQLVRALAVRKGEPAEPGLPFPPAQQRR
ncbi:tetraspanin-10 [Oryctolagus cuniculus]|uniref:tetraspanin-10 n=1 Tax=Oryctolagus cuniculus TaxID=9986 RepID=UPI00387947F7